MVIFLVFGLDPFPHRRRRPPADLLPLFTEPNVDSSHAMLAPNVWLKAGTVVAGFVSVEIGDAWARKSASFGSSSAPLSTHARRVEK